MAIAAKTSTGAVNLDATKSALTVPFVTASGDAVVVNVAVRAADVTVQSVTDSAGNTYTKKAAVFAQDVIHDNMDYTDEPMYLHATDAEVWTAIAGATAASTLTVTLTAGAKFGVAVQSYTGATTFPQASAVVETAVSNPTVTLTGMAAGSVLSAGFTTWAGLNQAVSVGTLRNEVTSGSEDVDIEVTVADNTVTATSSTVTLNPAQQVNYEGLTVPVALTYTVCAVEVHV